MSKQEKSQGEAVPVEVEVVTAEEEAQEAPAAESVPTDPTAADLKAKLERAQADYQNLRRRMLKDQERWESRAVCEFARRLLPVLDSFERALEHPGNTPEEFAKGLTLIQDQLRKAIEEQGIKPMDAEGKPFDPNRHEALSVFQNPSVPDQTVVQVCERGYAYRKEVVRTAKVIVSRGGPPQPDDQTDEAPEAAAAESAE